jgi:hypothetical protein
MRAHDPAKNWRDSFSEKSSIEVSSEAVLAASSLLGSAALAGLAAFEQNWGLPPAFSPQ